MRGIIKFERQLNLETGLTTDGVSASIPNSYPTAGMSREGMIVLGLIAWYWFKRR